MPYESVVYTINLIIGAILALMLTQHWRLAGRESSLGYWMAAAWTMTAADLLFALRPQLPYWAGRFFPTLMVTVGQVVLLLWAMRTGGRDGRTRLGVAIVAVHATELAWFLYVGGSTSSWRTVFNGLLWSALALAAYVYLRRAPAAQRSTLAIPAFVFLAHGLFHAFRLTLATAAAVGDAETTQFVQLIGDVEVSFFMVALFVSLLVAHLQFRNEELRAAHGDLRVLSGLLPICAWCRKVRSDDGYWQQIEEYFTARRGVTFTHGICDSCSAKQPGAEIRAGRGG